MARGSVNVLSTETVIVDSQSWTSVILQNFSGEAVYVQVTPEIDPLTVSNGLLLDVGGTISFTDGPMPRGQVKAICATGPAEVRYAAV